MNRVSLILLALIACLPAPAQDRDNSGFLLVSNTSPTMATVSTNPPAQAMPEATAMIASPPSIASQPDGSTPPAILGSDTNLVTSSMVAATSVYNLDNKHKLAPGDKISFEIVEDRTNAVPMQVTESSELDVPYIGRYAVGGKTCKELAADLKSLLEKDYYYKATVIIGLDAYSTIAGKVYVEGPVNHPGPVEIPANENFTVSKAILSANGFSDFADKKRVHVLRRTETGTQTLTVNVDAVFSGHIEQDITVTNGDIIDVPQSHINF